MPATDTGPRLVDTSIWIHADRKGHATLKRRLAELTLSGAAWICWPIRAELLIGLKTSSRWTTLNEQLAALLHVPVTDDTWHRVARLGHDLARTGQTVPLPDLLIAAAAIEHDLPLWTADHDFTRIATLAPLRLDGFGVGSLS